QDTGIGPTLSLATGLSITNYSLYINGWILENGNERVYNGGDVEMLESPSFIPGHHPKITSEYRHDASASGMR
ncbi:hypothetical protein Tsubulata_033575, partial [Turnera subulata]